MLWVDPTDPSVFFAVTELDMASAADADTEMEVREVIEAASAILTELSAHRIHPAGTSEEEFVCNSRLRRMRPVYGPVREVLSVTRQTATGAQEPLAGGWTLAQGAIHFPYDRRSTGRSGRGMLHCAPETGVFRVHYRFASTLSAAARNAVLEYARQLWLARQESAECQLPDRVTSISREGVSMEIFDPQDYLTNGKVGLPRVDTWLAGVNLTGKARRPAGVYTPDSPPAVPSRVIVTRTP